MTKKHKRERRIHLKYNIPYSEIINLESNLEHMLEEDKKFIELKELISRYKNIGVNSNVWKGQMLDHRIGYSVRLYCPAFIDKEKQDERLKTMLKIIFEKVGTPDKVYGEYDLIDFVLYNYKKRTKWALYGSRNVIDY